MSVGSLLSSLSFIVLVIDVVAANGFVVVVDDLPFGAVESQMGRPPSHSCRPCVLQRAGPSRMRSPYSGSTSASDTMGDILLPSA